MDRIFHVVKKTINQDEISTQSCIERQLLQIGLNILNVGDTKYIGNQTGGRQAFGADLETAHRAEMFCEFNREEAFVRGKIDRRLRGRFHHLLLDDPTEMPCARRMYFQDPVGNIAVSDRPVGTDKTRRAASLDRALPDRWEPYAFRFPGRS